mmetsp:Transcript_76655/g.225018  ORF Transcript_76655/g.225018 Transcript_76655/m.225018 type:complete len:107 (+) Transcript_76655:644-964(+)
MGAQGRSALGVSSSGSCIWKLVGGRASLTLAVAPAAALVRRVYGGGRKHAVVGEAGLSSSAGLFGVSGQQLTTSNGPGEGLAVSRDSPGVGDSGGLVTAPAGVPAL